MGHNHILFALAYHHFPYDVLLVYQIHYFQNWIYYPSPKLFIIFIPLNTKFNNIHNGNILPHFSHILHLIINSINWESSEDWSVIYLPILFC